MNQPSSDRRWPQWIYAHGAEPDPRFSLANERTFLAWIRTTLALLAGAAAVHAFDLDVDPLVTRAVAVVLAVAGLACAVYAWVTWSQTERALRLQRPLPSNATGVVVVAAVAIVGVLMVIVGARG